MSTTVAGAGAAANPSSKMDAMSRDELLLHAKKQLLLLHKTKAKCDEIASRNSGLEASLKATNVELAELRATKGELDLKISTAEADHLSLSRKIQDVQEQLDCMHMKEETANSTFLCFREEISSLQLENKTLKEETSLLKIARDDSIASLKSMKQVLNEQHADQVSRLHAENASLRELNEKMASDFSAERIKLEDRIDKASSSSTRVEIPADHCTNCDCLKQELESVKLENDKSKEAASEVETLLQSKMSEMEEAIASNDEWRVKYDELAAKVGRMTSEVGHLAQETSNLQTRLDEHQDNCFVDDSSSSAGERERTGVLGDDNDVEAIRVRLQEAEFRGDSAKSALELSEKERESLKNQLEIMQSSSQIEILTLRNDALKRDVVDYRRTIEEVDSDYQLLMRENEELKSASECLKLEHDSAATSLRASRDECETLKNRVQVLEEDNMNAITNFNSKTSEKADTEKLLNGENEILRTENEDLKSTCQRLQLDCQELKNLTEELRSKNEALEEKFLKPCEADPPKDENPQDAVQAMVAKLASKNGELHQTVVHLGTMLSTLDDKVSNFEASCKPVSETSSVACQTSENVAAMSEASVQVGNSICSEDVATMSEASVQDGCVSACAIITVDVATDCVDSADLANVDGTGCQNCEMLRASLSAMEKQSIAEVGHIKSEVFGMLVAKLDDLLKVVVVEVEGGSDDVELYSKQRLIIQDLQRWISDNRLFVADKEDLVRVIEKLGVVLDVVLDVRKTWQNAMEVKLQKTINNDQKGAAKSTAEADDVLGKYKMVALKAKKESAETKKKLEAVQRELSAMTKVKSSLEDEVRAGTLLLNEEKQKHKLTASSLQQHSSLISLEMADYERHSNDLAKQLADKQTLVGTLEKDVELQLEKIQGLHLQIEQLEKRAHQSEEINKQLKSGSAKLKSELANLQKSESDWKVRERSLSGRLESSCQEVEAYKMQLAEASATERELQSSMQAMQDAHNKTLKILETKIASMTNEMQLLRSEYEQCRNEYGSYKVRVHSVLKQQKTKSTSPVTVEVASEGREHFEKIIQSLQARIQEFSAQHSALQTETEALQEEHCNLLERHNKLVVNLADQESTWRQRLERLQSELRSEQQDQVELGRQLRLQQEAHRVATERHETSHQREMEKMQEQLGALEAQNLKLLRQKAEMESSNQADLAAMKHAALLASVGHLREEEQPLDVLSTERQEGEGSEFTDSLFSSSQKLRLSSPTSSFVPLEQLLSQDEVKSISSLSVPDLEKLENQLFISSKKIEHLAEILHESEANNARSTEQVRVLKEEIRRLERNQEREKHMANMEYLKNIIVKFLALTSGDERERLVPVLTTLLRLSPEEEQKIIIVAKGGAEAAGIASNWSSYLPLPRWPGTS